jgi:YD repeat-containing protein
MITFPPARIITDDPSIEPYIPDASIKAESSKSIRADQLLHYSGFKAISGKWFHTDNGIIFKIIESTITSTWTVTWFYWDGQTRRIVETTTKEDKAHLLAYLSESWLYEGKEGDALYDEAEHHLQLALEYNPKNDLKLISQNFELIISNIDKILSTSSMLNGALGGLRIVFVYLGMRRFPLSTLVALWKEGKWQFDCRHSKRNKHYAYVLSGGGGLSNGAINVYCPTCKKLEEIHSWSTSYFTSLEGNIPKDSSGLRLDEIIEALKAKIT